MCWLVCPTWPYADNATGHLQRRNLHRSRRPQHRRVRSGIRDTVRVSRDLSPACEAAPQQHACVAMCTRGPNRHPGASRCSTTSTSRIQHRNRVRQHVRQQPSSTYGIETG